MAKQLSEHLGVSPEALEDFGVFNGFVDLDSKLHVDPKLLKQSGTGEMQLAYGDIYSHFADLIKIIDQIEDEGDIFWEESLQRLIFPEIPGIALGYSKDGDDGTGIGKKLARNLLLTARKLIRAGIKSPELFELVGFLRNKIGADRISDMSIFISRHRFFEFTERVSLAINCITDDFVIDGITYKMPRHPTKQAPLIFVPMDVLRDLPVALDWSDIDLVSGHNITIRSSANRIIGTSWKRVAEEYQSDDLIDMIVESPSIFHDLIDKYRAKHGEMYNFDDDRLGELRWYAMSKDVAEKAPLDLERPEEWSLERAADLVRTIIRHIQGLVENNNLWELIYDRSERHAQRLVFGLAKSFCEANDLDISPEVNAGPGPVDFKFSHGSSIVVLIEVKLSTNGQMKHGYETQIEIYSDAENAGHSFFLVFLVGSVTPTLVALRDANAASIRAGEPVPELVEIDARPKLSASKRKSEA